VGFDLGCGSGRWARFVAERVGKLVCIDASATALEVARRNLAGHPGCIVLQAAAEAIPLSDGSADFGYSLGVLHHIENTEMGIKNGVRVLKPGAPFLIYLYYAQDNRPAWYRMVWRVSDVGRRAICSLPFSIKSLVCDIIAALVYWPLARAAKVTERMHLNPELIPLAVYRHRTFYHMRNDSLDRFGTRLEKRFTKQQIRKMLENAGLTGIRFSDNPPYWCAVGTKRGED
jgi:ubiquinone/menaquinone biosynthesis C-methylase UbiE